MVELDKELVDRFQTGKLNSYTVAELKKLMEEREELAMLSTVGKKKD